MMNLNKQKKVPNMLAMNMCAKKSKHPNGTQVFKQDNV